MGPLPRPWDSGPGVGPARCVGLPALLVIAGSSLVACAGGEPPSAATTIQSPRSTTSASALAPATTATAAITTTTVAQRRYVFPLDPPSVGDYGRGHHDYPATDIFTADGTPFVAVTSGTVDAVSTVDRWDPADNDPALRGGLFVSIVGDDGVRYYGSHLSAVEHGIYPGVRVSTGQVLGRTGRSGNARNTPPHVHFGISRPTEPDDWEVRRGQLDPYPFLEAWRSGGSGVTPVLPERDGAARR